MRRSSPVVILALCGLCLAAAAAHGQVRFPPPEFESGYTFPAVTAPKPTVAWHEYVDLALLAAALVVAAVLVLRVRRRGPIAAFGVICLLYFGFYRAGCICPIGAIQNVAMALTGGYAIPLVVLGFFLLPLVAALLFGRVFCASVCPLGAVQDLVALKPLRVPAAVDHALGLLPWAYLAAAVVFAVTGSALIICRYDPFVAIFRMVPIGKILEGWARRDPSLDPAALSGRLDPLLLGGAFLVIGMFLARPYCRWLCPYGVLLGLLSKLSWRRVTITPDECIQCRLCEDTCPMGAIREPTAKAPSHMRFRGRGALTAALFLLPLLVVAGGLLGGALGGTMAKMHPTVRLAERIRRENAGAVEGTTDESDAFRGTGEPADALYARAGAIEATFVSRWGPAWAAFGAAHLCGGFVGLVIGLKLVGLSIRRRRTDFEADRASCVGCGRCFASCPVERTRRQGKDVEIRTDA